MAGGAGEAGSARRERREEERQEKRRGKEGRKSTLLEDTGVYLSCSQDKLCTVLPD